MPFKKRLLGSEIALVISAGLFLTASPESADAQLPQYSCRPNDAGNGWICESTGPIESRNTADGTNRYNSDNAILPEGTEQEESPGFQFPLQTPQTEPEEPEESEESEEPDAPEAQAEEEAQAEVDAEQAEDEQTEQAATPQQPGFPFAPAP